MMRKIILLLLMVLLFVSSADELNNLTTKWSNSEAGLRIGICGATSTPLWLMEKVKEEIEKTQ